MRIISLTFDDDESDQLTVFSGQDLLVAHYDQVDLDWEEVAERARIDERRGLVIAQVAVLDDLIDEFILYLDDPPDPDQYRTATLDRLMVGQRVTRLNALLKAQGLLDGEAAELIADLLAVVQTRNRLAHGTIYRRPTRTIPIAELATATIELEWVLVDRRDRRCERVSMAQLRAMLHEAQGVFMALLGYAERFVEIAPRPRNYSDGWYLGAPSP